MENKEGFFDRLAKSVMRSIQTKIIRNQRMIIENLRNRKLDYEKWIENEIAIQEALNLERVEEILKMQKVTDNPSSKANYMAEKLKDEIKSSIASGKALLNTERDKPSKNILSLLKDKNK